MRLLPAVALPSIRLFLCPPESPWSILHTMSRHQHHHHNPHRHQDAKPKPFHRNKWFIIAVILMLIGMFIYVLTMDESVVPISADPAVTTPASP